MGGKKLLLLGTVFALLLAFVYFYEFRGKEALDKQEEKRNKFVQWKAGDVTRISIQKRGEPGLVLAKSGEQWKLIQPVAAMADSAVVGGVVQAITDAAADRAIEKPDLQKYGLKDPPLSIEIEEGGKKHQIRFGDKDFTGGSVYATHDSDPNVFLLTDTVYTRATQPVADFRDKSVLDFETETASRIEIRRKDGVLVLEKEKDNWMLRQPSQDAADRTIVDGLLSAVRYARIQTFVEESLDHLKQYGLDPPLVRISVSSGDKKAELNLGRVDGENQYGYVPGRTAVFTVPKDIGEKAEQPLDKFQSREILRFARDQTTRIDVKGEKGRWVAEKKGDQWKVLEPAGHDKKEFLEYKVFLALEDLRAEEVLPPNAVALGAPLVVWRLEAGEPLQIEIFRQGSGWYVRSSQVKRLFKISETQGQALNEPLDRFVQ